MSIHFPKERRNDIEPIECWEHLKIDQDYAFMGHIIDMSLRRDTDSSIPEKPYMKLEAMTQKDLIEFRIGDLCEKHIPSGQDFYFCRVNEFSTLPKEINTSQKNQAIINYIKALDRYSFVIIKMSW